MSASDAGVIAGALGITGVNGATAISFDVLTASIWANIEAIAAWLVTNPIGWAILAGTAIYGVVKAVDYFTVSTEEAMESLEETSQAFEQSTSDLQSLNDELKTTKDRISELEKLKNSGKISVAEQDELDKLKEENKELERNIVLKKQEQIENAKAVLTDLDNADIDVKSKYDTKNVHGSEVGNEVTRAKEASMAQDEYNKLLSQRNELEKQEAELLQKQKDGTFTTEDKKESVIRQGKRVNIITERSDKTKLEEVRKQIKEINGDLKDTDSYIGTLYDENAQKKISAYESLIDAGVTLDDTQQADYDSLIALEDAYLMHCYRVQQTETAYKALNAEQQKSVLLDKLKEKGYTDEQANAIVNSINEDDLDDYYTADFNFKLPNINDYDGDIQKWAKDFANVWSSHVNSELKDTDKTDNLSEKSFEQIWNSLGTGTDETSKKVAEEKENLLKLAEAGQLTEEAFKNSSIVDTFTKAGYSIEEATKKLNAFIDNTKQLSAMKTGITAITSAYDEKKEAKDNRVGSDTLNSLYGTLGIQEWENKDLKVWEQYKNIASDSKSSLTELKDAQDELATSFVNSNNFLSSLNEENEEYYKNLLAEMGVTNAESIVTEKLAGKKEFHALKSKALTAAQSDLSNKTDDASASFLEEAACCDEAKFALADYVAKETIFNNSNLNVDDKVTALENLAEAYYGAAAAASFENKIKTSAEGAMYGGGTISPEKAWKQIQKDYGKIKPVKVDVKTSKGNKSDNKSDNKKDTGSKSKNTKTEINWLERRLTRMQSIIDLTASKLQNLFSVKAKNSNLDNQIKQSTKLMNQYKIAADTYIKKANSVAKSGGLSKDIINKVQSGEITKSSYSKLIKKYGQKKADKINSYIDYYDKSQDAKKNAIDLESKIRGLKQDKLQNYVDLYDSRTSRAKAKEDIAIGATDKNKAVDTQIKNTKLSYDYQIKIAELTEDKAKADQLEYEKQKAIVDLKKQQIENLKTEYDNRIGLINNSQQNIDNQLSQMEARGQIIKSSYYSSLNNYENQKLSKLNSELADLQAKEQQKTFTKFSQEWYDLQSDIQSVKNAINDAKVAIIENNKKVGELRQAMYDDIAERNSNISTEASFLAGLLGDNLTDDKTGNLTKEGLAMLGTYAIDMESNTSTVLSYKKDCEELEKQIADYKNGNSHALDAYGSLDAAKKALDEIIKKQQDAISAEYANEKQIYDLMTQRYETQLSYMQSIIDAKKNLLQMEKDLYDYEKNINNQTKSIASLEKQLTALQGDDSEAGRLRRSQLQQSLDEANQELQDTEYERYISDQQNMLDNLYSQYEDLIHELEKNFEKVVNDGVELINTKSGEISTAITDYAKKYGYNPSVNMKSILDALTSSGDGDVKTLPGAINNGLSNLGMIFQKGVTDIINAYTGSKSDTNNSNNGSDNTSDRTKGEKQAQNFSTNYQDNLNRAKESLNNTTQKISENYANIIASGIASGKSNTTKVETAAERNKKIQSAISYINSHLSTAKKKKSEYSAVNQSFYSKWGKKVLSDSELKDLANIVGVTYDNSSKTGNLYKRLKDLGIAGFKRGGIGQLVKASGEDGFALVRNGEGFIAPEHVDAIKDLVNIVPDMTQFTKTLTNIKPVSRNIGNTFGDIVINAELPNVKDSYDFVDDIQNNRRVQQALTIGVKDVVEKGKITNNIQSVR